MPVDLPSSNGQIAEIRLRLAVMLVVIVKDCLHQDSFKRRKQSGRRQRGC